MSGLAQWLFFEFLVGYNTSINFFSPYSYFIWALLSWLLKILFGSIPLALGLNSRPSIEFWVRLPPLKTQVHVVIALSTPRGTVTKTPLTERFHLQTTTYFKFNPFATTWPYDIYGMSKIKIQRTFGGFWSITFWRCLGFNIKSYKPWATLLFLCPKLPCFVVFWSNRSETGWTGPVPGFVGWIDDFWFFLVFLFINFRFSRRIGSNFYSVYGWTNWSNPVFKTIIKTFCFRFYYFLFQSDPVFKTMIKIFCFHSLNQSTTLTILNLNSYFFHLIFSMRWVRN